MHKLLAIAHREFNAMIGTKAFLFSLVMMPVLMVGGIVALPALSRIGGTKTREIVIADATGQYFESIHSAAETRNRVIESIHESSEQTVDGKSRTNDDPFSAAETWDFRLADTDRLEDSDRLRLSDEIRDGGLYAFVEILPAVGGNRSDAPQIQFVSQDAMLSGARRWLENHLRDEVRTRNLSALGIDPTLVAKANVPVVAKPMKPFKRNQDGSVSSKEGAAAMASLFLPMGIMMLMFVVIFMAAQPMLESGMEEKSARIAELLLGCVTPTQLMAGKLIGNVAGSFVIFAVYAVGGWLVLQQNDWDIELPWSLMPWMMLFQILGVLFFSSIFLTIGASVSELKEAQSLLLPVWLVLMLPMMVWFIAVRDPNGIVPVALSFFPPSAPMMMSLRLATAQSIPVWHAPVAALVMLSATAGVVLLAARLYRASLLKSDSATSVSQLIKRFRASE